MSLVVHGIPTCGTVKKARAWLDAHGLPHSFVDLRKAPPSHEQVKRWVEVLGAAPMRNTSGGSYRALGPDKATWDDATWVDAFHADPMLVRRPLVERDGVPVLVGFRGSDEELLARLSG